MKIVFITPAPFLRRLPVYRLGGNFYGQSNAITGPLILGGILKRAGHDVEVYEELYGKADYKKLIPKTDIFCFSIMTSNAPRAYDLADMIRKTGHARIIMGGMHATALPAEALAHCDQVMAGEGESSILDVVEGRRTEKVIRCRSPRSLDDVPFPDYSILKTPCKSANILTTRGCPFRCTFCTTSRMFAPYRQRSVDSVIDEIKAYKRLGFKYMNFEDDNFTADKERAKEICRRMIAENLQFKETFFFGRTDLARDEELLDLLARAHLTRVLIGIESLNQKALDSVDKHQSITDIKNAAEACRRHGIRLIASIVLGIDADTREDIRRSVDFAKSIDAYQLQPAILTPYPGTPIYERYLADGRLLAIDWTQFDMMNVTFQPMNMSPWELQEEFYHATKHFYNFSSAMRIWSIFGSEYGIRRLGLAVCARLGTLGAHLASRVKSTSYYKLRNIAWTGPFSEEPSGESSSSSTA